MKYLILLILIVSNSYANHQQEPLTIEFGSYIGEQKLNKRNQEFRKSSFLIPFVSFNMRLHENHQINFAFTYRNFEESKLSHEALNITYINYFKYNWEYQIIYSPQFINMISKDDTNKNLEVFSNSIQWKFLLGKTLINKKYYRMRLLGGLGYQFITSMSSSHNHNKTDIGEKEGGFLYEITPLIEIRNDNDRIYSMGFSYQRTHVKTSSFQNQNQEFLSARFGISFN